MILVENNEMIRNINGDTGKEDDIDIFDMDANMNDEDSNKETVEHQKPTRTKRKRRLKKGKDAVFLESIENTTNT